VTWDDARCLIIMSRRSSHRSVRFFRQLRMTRDSARAWPHLPEQVIDRLAVAAKVAVRVIDSTVSTFSPSGCSCMRVLEIGDADDVVEAVTDHRDPGNAARRCVRPPTSFLLITWKGTPRPASVPHPQLRLIPQRGGRAGDRDDKADESGPDAGPRPRPAPATTDYLSRPSRSGGLRSSRRSLPPGAS
jgi:hypothetical protein